MRKLLTLLALAALAAAALAQRFTLVVAGDSRSDPTAKPPRPEDKNGINTLIAAEIAAAVVKEKARALLWTGDLVFGDRSNRAVHKSQLQDWVKIMKPVWNAGIRVYPVRGNHEANSMDSAAVWKEVFKGPYALPKNGPLDARNMTYWVEVDNVLILGIDQYAFAHETSPVRWVSDTIAARKKPHIFAFGHEMAFFSGNHKDNLSSNARNRDDFIGALIAAKSRAYFAAHDHFYDHLIASKEGVGTIHQFVIGTSGAPKYEADPNAPPDAGWSTSKVLHLPRENGQPIVYGYILIEIDGPKARITFKGRTAPGKYVPMDTWSYTAG